MPFTPIKNEWCVLIAMPSYDAAMRLADAINAVDPSLHLVPAPWPNTPDAHARALAQQHRNR